MPRRPNLSPREIEVLQGVSEGLTNKEIAEWLEIHPLTVKAHLDRMSEITLMRNRAGMVGWGFREGVLT